MMKVSDDITNALRDETPLPTAKLNALRTFTLQVMQQRGNVTDAELQAFFDAGYSHRAVLDVILGLAQKTMSNYVNHMAQTPVDEVMQGFLWERKVSEPA